MKSDKGEKRRKNRMATVVTQAGREPFEHFGFVNPPIYRGSTVLFPTVADLEGLRQPYTYGTKGTPTTRALETAWTEIAGAEDTVLVPSGLAAIAIALLTATKAGAHLLVTDSAYAPTRFFCDGFLARFGVTTEYYDPEIGAGVSALIRPETTAILTESPGSQSMEIQDIPAIAAAAREKGVCVIVDNTWATPLFFPPHERGCDLAVDAGTKYLSGHSDLLMGLVSANAKWAKRLRHTFNLFAIGSGPDDASLALRGLRTMALRLREQERAALEIATWLEARPEIARVLHPALPGHPGHDLWKRDFSGSSGVFSIILKPVAKAAVESFVDGLALFGIGFSWGGYESLVLPFDCAPFRTATRWAPEGPALRFSIGLEDVADLKDDLEAAFARLGG
ncbi:cystathionine beta-lyase [Methylocystis parvus]|uniref:Cystathionine beta-lyase n=2 Tax=Methylocystis parvus TaxID=134 RepID=A0A6B8M889_9HYPH|nr:cystathionine beta-lyase [Methylocystis parvus]